MGGALLKKIGQLEGKVRFYFRLGVAGLHIEERRETTESRRFRMKLVLVQMATAD